MKNKKVKSKIFHYNFLGKNRRGSHVDVVISFVIFVIFMGFLYSIISPIKIQEDKETILNYLEKEVKEELSANFTRSSINIYGSYTSACYEINHIIDFVGLDVIVKDENDALVRFGLNEDIGNNKTYLRIDATPGKKFFKIYYSEEDFEDFPLNETCSFTDGQYVTEAHVIDGIKTTGLVRTEEYVFESKVNRVLSNKTKYKEVKENLNLPLGTEFSFDFTYSNGTSIEIENKKNSANIYVKAVPVKYVDSQANINNGFINIKLW